MNRDLDPNDFPTVSDEIMESNLTLEEKMDALENQEQKYGEEREVDPDDIADDKREDVNLGNVNLE